MRLLQRDVSSRVRFAGLNQPVLRDHRCRLADTRSGWMRTPGRGVLLQCPMWPMNVVMLDVLIKDQSQVPLVGDQHPVQVLAPGAGDPQ
jgi:hypothetical protein